MMFTTQIFTAAVVSAFLGQVQSAALPLCSRQYTVQSGDVCDTISAAQHVSTYQLALVNQGTINSDCSNLFSGEVICLGVVGQDCTTTHVVAAGETCTSIAANAGTTYSTLIANNPNVNAACTNTYPGEVLCTANTVIPYNLTSST